MLLIADIELAFLDEIDKNKDRIESCKANPCSSNKLIISELIAANRQLNQTKKKIIKFLRSDYNQTKLKNKERIKSYESLLEQVLSKQKNNPENSIEYDRDIWHYKEMISILKTL